MRPATPTCDTPRRSQTSLGLLARLGPRRLVGRDAPDVRHGPPRDPAANPRAPGDRGDSVPSADLFRRALTNKFPPRPPHALSHGAQPLPPHDRSLDGKGP